MKFIYGIVLILAIHEYTYSMPHIIYFVLKVYHTNLSFIHGSPLLTLRIFKSEYLNILDFHSSISYFPYLTIILQLHYFIYQYNSTVIIISYMFLSRTMSDRHTVINYNIQLECEISVCSIFLCSQAAPAECSRRPTQVAFVVRAIG